MKKKGIVVLDEGRVSIDGKAKKKYAIYCCFACMGPYRA